MDNTENTQELIKALGFEDKAVPLPAPPDCRYSITFFVNEATDVNVQMRFPESKYIPGIVEPTARLINAINKGMLEEVVIKALSNFGIRNNAEDLVMSIVKKMGDLSDKNRPMIDPLETLT